MSYKYVVGCGCSFLETHQPWFLSIPSERYVNLSKGGCGNEFIKHQLVFKISELISDNVNPKDIFKEAVSLDSYESKDFYKDDGLKYEVNDDFFEQASMIAYNKEIYS